MKRIAAIVATVLVAGCALSPIEVEERGERQTTQHSTSAEATAQCIVDHIDRTETLLLGRKLPKPGDASVVQVIVRILGEAPDTGAVIDISRTETGSRAIWMLNPGLFSQDSFLRRARGPC